MPNTVQLPALGESVEEGTVSRWLKAVGDTVAVDEPLLEVSTDKVDTEIPSPFAGVLLEILAAEDSTVSVGADLAVIGEPGSAPAPAAAPVAAAPVAAPAAPAPVAAAAPAPVAAAPAPVAAAPVAAPAPVAAAPAGDIKSYITPLVRTLATEQGVDLSAVTGTGVGGRIRKEDVIAAGEALRAAAAAVRATASAPAAAPAAAKAAIVPSPLRGTTEKMTNLRKIVASRMVEAMTTQAQLTTVVEVDVTKVAQLRAKAKAKFQEREGANLTFLSFYTLAAVEALKVHPKINASIDTDAGTITYHGVENVGLAVDTEKGLMVPVIKGAGDLNIAGIARSIADLGGRARVGKITADEMQGATFTITNTGSGGSLFDTPVVPVGQVAILGTGAMVKRPAVVTGPDGMDVIAIRQFAHLFLSYDHRLVDGADAARYLTAVKARIEEGAFEADLGLV